MLVKADFSILYIFDKKILSKYILYFLIYATKNLYVKYVS